MDTKSLFKKITQHFLTFLVMIIFLFGCAHYSRNIVKHGSFDFRGGKIADLSWSDGLSFRRTSWFNELTLSVDILWQKVDRASPFYQWFSKDERATVEKCADFYIALFYTLESKKYSLADFRVALEPLGLTERAVTSFAKNLDAHPDYFNQGFNPYKVVGMCGTGVINSVDITIPGFSTQQL